MNFDIPGGRQCDVVIASRQRSARDCDADDFFSEARIADVSRAYGKGFTRFY
jgi:hypothetical protein